MGPVGIGIEVFIGFVVLVSELNQLVGAVEGIGLIALGVIRSGNQIALGIVGVGAARLVESEHKLVKIGGVRLTVEHHKEADAVHLFIRIGGKNIALILLGRGVVIEMDIIPLEGAVFIFYFQFHAYIPAAGGVGNGVRLDGAAEFNGNLRAVNVYMLIDIRNSFQIAFNHITAAGPAAAGYISAQHPVVGVFIKGAVNEHIVIAHGVALFKLDAVKPKSAVSQI